MIKKADSRRPKSAYEQYWGRPIAVVRGTTLGIPDGMTFGSVEQRKVDGIEDIMKEIYRNKERAIMEWDGPDDFTEESAAQEIWVVCPLLSRLNPSEDTEPPLRIIQRVTIFRSATRVSPTLTGILGSSSAGGLDSVKHPPAWYFDIVERASSKVLKPPKDLQMLNLWGSQTVVLDTIEYNSGNAHAKDVIENGKVHRIPIPIPEDHDERYREAAGSTVVVLRDYQVVAHVQVPLVVF
ncbi:hypothetical protein PENSPDRAFT_668419 [Peniophora sp. CONT]|nr:hypothetical protein PENSPDRAFT_668419 [Peniophora sp. CONT]